MLFVSLTDTRTKLVGQYWKRWNKYNFSMHYFTNNYFLFYLITSVWPPVSITCYSTQRLTSISISCLILILCQNEVINIVESICIWPNSSRTRRITISIMASTVYMFSIWCPYLEKVKREVKITRWLFQILHFMADIEGMTLWGQKSFFGRKSFFGGRENFLALATKFWV